MAKTGDDISSSRGIATGRDAVIGTGLDRLTVGFALFDARLRLLAWNAPFESLRGYPGNLLQKEVGIEEFLRFSAEHGDFGTGDPDRLIRDRVDSIRKGNAEELRFELSGGKTLQLRIDPLPDSVLITCSDVTEQLRTVKALRDNEERYSLLAEAVEEGLYDWYIESDEIYVSPRLQRFFKFEVGELGPKDWNWNSRIYPDDLQHYLDTLDAHFRGELPRWQCEYRFRNKEGEYRWVLDHGYSTRDKQGKVERLVGAIRDIDQRKKVEEALRESESRYELALRAINEGVYDWDIKNDAVLYSDRVYEVLGLSREDVSSPDDWLQRIHREDIDEYKAALVSHFKGETDRFEHEFRYLGHADQWRWARQHGIALRDEEGYAYRMIGSTGDITELKNKERELAEKTNILETTLENIDQGITMVDKNLQTIALNSRFLELLELPPERFGSGFHMEEAFRFNAERGEYGPGDIEQQVRERVELARKFQPHSFERIRPDGTVIAVRGKPLPEGGFVSTYTDVTERRRAETALRENEERYSLASKAATEGIYDWNIETNSLFLSDRTKTFFALPSGPLTPEAWNARIHPDDFAGYRLALIEYFKGKKPALEHEYRIRDAGGGYRWILDRGIATRDETGRVTRLVGAISDMTPRKLAELELRRARDAAQAATHAKSNFLANMSHELRTPLNAIIGFARIVMRRSGQSLEKKQYENLKKILVSADHLLALINNILDLSKIEAERVDVVPTEVELVPLLNQCIQTVEPLIDPGKVELRENFDPDLGKMITDGEKVRQIVINLLSNAAKFTERGSIELCTEKADTASVAISVADTGIGIPEDKLSTIFEEFSQVDGSSTREYGGTGLGLSIGRRLAQLLGGDIEVESTEGLGSKFTLRLPINYSSEPRSRLRQPVS